MELYQGIRNENDIKTESGIIDVGLSGGESRKGFYIGNITHETYN